MSKNEKNQKLTAYESYKKIESEVRFQTNLLEKPNQTMKCPFHQFKHSKNCRECKKIVVEDIPTYQEKDINMDKYHYDVGDRGDNLIPIRGENPLSNMNTLIKQNILSCPYYRDLIPLRDLQEIIAEIDKIVTNVETWAGPGVPSSFFCILYKVMSMNINVQQLQMLCDWKLNPHVRCLGLLYLRYSVDPNFLWAWMRRHILDHQEFRPSKDTVMTIGEYCQKLLTDLNYYNTRLPRIPQQIDTIIQAKILLAQEKRQRSLINQRILPLLLPGAQVRAISQKDDEWHIAKIESVDNPYLVVEFQNNKERINLGEIELIPKNEEQKIYIAQMITEGMQEGQIVMPQEIIQEEQRSKSHSKIIKKSSSSSSRSRSRNKNHDKKKKKHKKHRDHKDHKDHKNHREHREHKDKKSKDYDKHSKKKVERKESKSPEIQVYETNKERQERLEREIRKKQMEKAVANSKQDVAKIPASYKTSLSAALPTSSKPQRQNSPSPVIRKEKFVDLGNGDQQQLKKEDIKQDQFNPIMNELNKKYGSNNEKKVNLEQSDRVNNDYQ